ncbi:hypothetical protein COP2_017519 [Malus domestica]
MDANGNGSVEFDEQVSAILPDMDEKILVNHQSKPSTARDATHPTPNSATTTTQLHADTPLLQDLPEILDQKRRLTQRPHRQRIPEKQEN